MIAINIRQAESRDIDDVYALICELEDEVFDQETFAAIFEENLRHPGYRYYVAELEQKVAGMISLHSQRLLHHCGVVGEVQELIVKEIYRGRGIGEALLGQALLFSKERSWLQVEVSSNKKRSEAHQFYLKNGFSQNHFKFVKML